MPITSLLIVLGRSVGLTDPPFAESITSGRYRPWAALVTNQAVKRGVQGTPTTLVDGVAVPANAEAIVAAIRSHARV